MTVFHKIFQYLSDIVQFLFQRVIIYRVALHLANYYIFTVRQIRLEW